MLNQRPRAREALVAVMGGLAVAAALAARWYHAHPFISDDAWISARYAWNLVEGNGLTWSPDLRPVEGYSNLLWTLWTALGIALGLPVDRWLAASGIGFAFGSALCTAAAARAGGAGRPAAFAAALLVALSPLMGRWMTLGLETPMFTFLLALGCWRGMVELTAARAGGSRFPLSGLAFGLACLCRAEGPFYLLIPLSFLLANGRGIGRGAILGFVLAAVPVTVQLLGRLVVYGELVPNTVRVKAPTGFATAVLEGLRYVATGLTYNVALTFTVGVGLLALLAWARNSLPLLVPGLACALFATLVGGDDFSELRFLLPSVPVTLAAAAIGWTALLARAGRTVVPMRVLAVGLALSSGRAEVLVNAVRVQPAVSSSFRGGPDDMRPPTPWFQLKPPYADVSLGQMWFASDRPRLDDELKPVHWFLAYLVENLKPGDAFLFQEVGLVGYALADSPLLDARGLNWRVAADLGRASHPDERGTNAPAARAALMVEFEALRPAIVFLQCDGSGFHGPAEGALFSSDYLLDNYRFVARGPYFVGAQVCLFRLNTARRPTAEQTLERYARMARDAPGELDWASRYEAVRSGNALPAEQGYTGAAPPMVVREF